MKNLSIHITISPELYIKNPESSDLGRKIISESIKMIDALGFESFTFKKLGVVIASNESSIYRYFSSKHSLLVYLISWYWTWIEYKLVFATANMINPETKLKEAILLLTMDITEDDSFTFINEVLLNKIIISESAKAYYTKDVDAENKKGYYKTYKRVVERVSELVLEVNPAFNYPHMLVSTVIEGSHHQRYFSQHLPALTDFEEGKNNIVVFYTDLIFNTLKK